MSSSSTWAELGLAGTALNYNVLDERGNTIASGFKAVGPQVPGRLQKGLVELRQGVRSMEGNMSLSYASSAAALVTSVQGEPSLI